MGVTIDLLRCTGCGNCLPVCPVGVLSLVDMKCTVADGCTECGACVDACTFHAIAMEGELAAAKE